MARHTGGLSEQERSFVHETVYGVLRRLLYIDYRLGFYLTKPQKLKPQTMMNLRIGAYQILFMRVPDWAAVSETVEVEKRTGRNPSVVNAVLRKIATLKEEPPLPGDPLKRLSISTSHPLWLVQRWVRRFGLKEAESLMEANNAIPPIVLRVNILRTTRQTLINYLKNKGMECEETRYSPFGIKLKDRPSKDLLAELSSVAMVQDEGAQLCTMLLSPRPQDRILDACASPGGKTAFLRELTQGRANIVAVEVSPERARILRKNLKTLGHDEIDIIEADIKRLTFGLPFQRILLDAPCSSFGVIRRNPDVRYRYSSKDLQEFGRMQLELLQAVSRFLDPGGTLLYSVCSLEPEETVEVVEAFLQKNSDFYIIKDVPEGIDNRFFDERGFFMSLPHRDDMDGHFGVRLSRR